MKKLFSLLTLALLTMSAWAATQVTFTFSELDYTNGASLDGVTETIDGVTLTYAKNNGSNPPAYYNNGSNLRFYVNNTLKVEAADNITGIAFTYTTGSSYIYWPAVDNGAIDSNGNWSGNATSITFTNNQSGKQVRLVSMVVTLDDGGTPAITVAAPVFSPVSGTKFIRSETITLTCETEGADIYYSTNDEEGYQIYDAPFTITETSTIKAYAELNGTKSSNVTAKYYRLSEANNLAQANALNNNTDFIFYGNAVVTYRNGSYVYLKDDTGYGLMYGNQIDANITEGMTLAEEWEANFYLFSGMPEYRYPSNVRATDDALVEIAPIEYALNEIDSLKMHRRIMLKGITLTKDDNNNLCAGDLQLYNQFGVELPTDVDGNTYDLEAMVSYHNGLQLYPITITLAGGQPIVTCAAPTLPESQTFTDSFEVEITNNEEGATVYYALNNGEYEEYTGPFTVEETTTVKAYATIDGVNSEEVTATYTKVEPAIERTFALVTDVAELADGDMIILVNSGVATPEEAVDYAMGEPNNNNFGHAEVTITEDLTITTDAANVITLEAQGENWAMKVKEGYLFAASSTANQLKYEAEVDDNAIAAITIDEAGAATIVFQGTNTRNYLRYNPNTSNNNPLFSCYAEDSSVQNPVYIYKVKGDEPEVLLGDVNGDNVVNPTDATVLINALLNENYSNIVFANSDMDGNGDVNVTDAILLINMLLTM